MEKELENALLSKHIKRYVLAEDAILEYLKGYSTGSSARILHFIKRIWCQLITGSLSDKKDFFLWVKNAFMRKNIPDGRFNPLWDIYTSARKILEVARRPDLCTDEKSTYALVSNVAPYRKFDVLFFSVIDYDFRHQRPQQIAEYFAKQGHRVFYFDVNFVVGHELVVKETCQNLFEIRLSFSKQRSIYSKGFSDVQRQLETQLRQLLHKYSIMDSVIIAEYPNWISAIRFLRKGYSWACIVDYLDDWDGFKDTATKELVSNTKLLLSECEGIVASSQYLADKSRGYGKNVSLIRNGTEFSHFNSVFKNMGQRIKTRQTIGYYGAIAHWFDIGKIKAVATALPQVDIELIGEVTTNIDAIKDFPNVKFLGEKSYQELPGLIRDWDVCLIPFDTTSNLIKATNPVKFYEYLSAGKKVVATELPEVMPYKGKYAYLENADDCFVQAVVKCLNKNDNLATPEECAAFASENDWTKRVRSISNEVECISPKFSIIVLSYNQLEYTKVCVGSILNWTAYPNFEVIIVDNCSRDGTREYLIELSARDRRVQVIINDSNLGFAAGNNVGIKAATGDYIVLLNNDTIISPGWLSRMLAHFRRHANCGALCPVTNSIGNEAMIKVHYETLEEFKAEAITRSYSQAFKYRTLSTVIAMYCFCIPKRVLDDVGPISVEYGRGMFEDDDYCKALHNKGYSTDCIEDVLVHHFHSVSFNAIQEEDRNRLFERNKAIFEKKWNCRWKSHKYREGIFYGTNIVTQLSFDRILCEGLHSFCQIDALAN